MDKHLTFKEQANERKLAVDYIVGSGCTHDITLNTYQSLSQSRTVQLADLLIHKMAQKIARITDESVNAIKLRWNWIRHYECASGNSHLHCVATLTAKDVKLIDGYGRKLWGD
jgi:hypothetical protein